MVSDLRPPGKSVGPWRRLRAYYTCGRPQNRGLPHVSPAPVHTTECLPGLVVTYIYIYIYVLIVYIRCQVRTPGIKFDLHPAPQRTLLLQKKRLGITRAGVLSPLYNSASRTMSPPPPLCVVVSTRIINVQPRIVLMLVYCRSISSIIYMAQINVTSWEPETGMICVQVTANRN